MCSTLEMWRLAEICTRLPSISPISCLCPTLVKSLGYGIKTEWKHLQITFNWKGHQTQCKSAIQVYPMSHLSVSCNLQHIFLIHSAAHLVKHFLKEQTPRSPVFLKKINFFWASHWHPKIFFFPVHISWDQEIWYCLLKQIYGFGCYCVIVYS